MATGVEAGGVGLRGLAIGSFFVCATRLVSFQWVTLGWLQGCVVSVCVLVVLPGFRVTRCVWVYGKGVFMSCFYCACVAVIG